MNLLLDTQIILWILTDAGKLKKKEKVLITDSSNEIICSSISLFEISFKYSIGKLKLYGFQPDDIPDLLTSNGYGLKNADYLTLSSFYKLPNKIHKDPFDRILIWEALKNNFTLMTRDEDVKKYAEFGLKVI